MIEIIFDSAKCHASRGGRIRKPIQCSCKPVIGSLYCGHHSKARSNKIVDLLELVNKTPDKYKLIYKTLNDLKTKDIKTKDIKTKDLNTIVKLVETGLGKDKERDKAALIIQKMTKGHLIRLRKRLLNEYDCINMDHMIRVPLGRLIRLEDDNKTGFYGFDLITLGQYLRTQSSKKNPIIHPFTGENLKPKEYDFINKEIGKYMKRKIDDGDILSENDGSQYIEKQIDFRIMGLFYKLDGLGYYTNADWLLKLSCYKLKKIILNLHLLWMTADGLSDEDRDRILPSGPLIKFPDEMTELSLRLNYLGHYIYRWNTKHCLEYIYNTVNRLISESELITDHQFCATLFLSSLSKFSPEAQQSTGLVF